MNTFNATHKTIGNNLPCKIIGNGTWKGTKKFFIEIENKGTIWVDEDQIKEN